MAKRLRAPPTRNVAEGYGEGSDEDSQQGSSPARGHYEEVRHTLKPAAARSKLSGLNPARDFTAAKKPSARNRNPSPAADDEDERPSFWRSDDDDLDMQQDLNCNVYAMTGLAKNWAHKSLTIVEASVLTEISSFARRQPMFTGCDRTVLFGVVRN